MATEKVLYFTANTKPTTEEAAEIAAIAALPGYVVAVRNAIRNTDEATAVANPEEADWVAGTPPEPYDDDQVYPVLDVGDIPTPGLVEEGDTIVLTDAAGTTLDCTLVITDGVPTLTMATTAKIIKSGVEFLSPDQTGSWVDGHTPTIVAGAVTVLAGS